MNSMNGSRYVSQLQQQQAKSRVIIQPTTNNIIPTITINPVNPQPILTTLYN